ncbi:hypothetical protein BUE93_22185 [Chromobacterium amazonense]|uniref:Uncharacterized protein n=1 Tax=Chromobacterium amazonense TaxID=1382803 RepID=A0A2S9WYG1_9NEIS|nr:hypothetical protein [Chromobacterium amazonense]PRP68512.1 hypothetical protein BUE93_22185 [Chromobacterium amazonense]
MDVSILYKLKRNKNAIILIFIFYCIFGSIGWFKYYNEPHIKDIQYDNLSPHMTVSYVRAIVWYHSRGKLQELRSILLTDDLSNEKQVKTRITNMLKHRTTAYIRDFNSMSTPVTGLGDWYESNFEFEAFLNEVFNLVFDKKLSVDEKLRDISDVMEKYQNETNLKLISKLKVKEN